MLGFNGQPLTGAGVNIGQVEPNRPGNPSIDSAANSNSTVNPGIVYFYQSDTNFNPTPNSVFNNNPMDPNYNPNPSETTNGNSLMTEFVDWSASKFDILYVVAGNETPPPTAPGPAPLPTDNFNGLTVGSSSLVNGTGKFREISSFDVTTQDPPNRGTVDLIAPGATEDYNGPFNTGVDTTDYGSTNPTANVRGTSFAAPLVTGTIALLQQYGNQRSNPVNQNWSEDYVHHEVMKAVLMNSADKLIDDHTISINGNLVPQGGLLGMDRTVVWPNTDPMTKAAKPLLNWLDSPANDDDINNATTGGSVALDPQVGTGELDAKRALKQFAAGEFHSFQVSSTYTEVPVIGWDYGLSDPRGENFPSIYRLNQKLAAGSFISITLTFDRTVVKSGDSTKYSSTDSFTPSTIPFGNPGYDQYSDLDLYLLPKNSFNINDAIAESISNSGTVDHIFFQIPTEGEYEFWVDPFNTTMGAENYAVAWWADGVDPLTSGRGDINQDGHVDVNDIVAMLKALANESNFASTNGITTDYLSLLGDVNGDGLFNNADIQALIDLLLAGDGSTTPVPEPSSFIILAVGGLLMGRVRSRKIRNWQRRR